MVAGGGAKGVRTPDLDTASVALYQLSYGPTSRRFRRIGVYGATPLLVYRAPTGP